VVCLTAEHQPSRDIMKHEFARADAEGVLVCVLLQNAFLK